MARRSDHTREELRELIIEVSWSIIAKHGVEGLTARRIAENIGYTPGTIYNLFHSMDDICLQINAKTLDLLVTALNSPECRDPDKSPVRNMKEMARCYMEFARKYKPYWLMLFNIRVTENRLDAGWYHEKVNHLFMPLEELLKPYFSAKQDEERKSAARVLWASVHGLCFLQETGKISIVGDEAVAPDMAGYLIDTFVAGIQQRH